MSTAVDYPRQVQMMITERCNLRCKHCAVPEEDSPADHELTTSAWLNYIGLLAKSGIHSLVISGGEAFLRNDIVQLAVYAHEQGMQQTTIVTNTSLITPQIAQEIASAQKKYPHFGVQISIDGASSATHDWMRGRGSFNVLLRNVTRLMEQGGAVTGVNTVLHRGNYIEFEAIAELTYSICAQNWRLFPIAELGRGTNIQNVVLTVSEWREIFRALPTLREKYQMDIMSMGPILGEDAQGEDGLVPNPNAYRTSTYCVGPDGDFFVCPPLRQYSLGKITLLEVGNNWQQAIQKGDKLTRDTCSNCKFLLLCVGVNANQPLRQQDGSVSFQAKVAG